MQYKCVPFYCMATNIWCFKSYYYQLYFLIFLVSIFFNVPEYKQKAPLKDFTHNYIGSMCVEKISSLTPSYDLYWIKWAVRI